MGSEQEKARLLKLYERSLQAHFEQDARTFLAEYAPHWYSVSNGTSRLRTKEEALPGVEDYFGRTHFADISQITAPIIHLSADASMAWMLAEIRVRAVQTQPDGTVHDFSFRCAWVSIYEKDQDEWTQIVNASTFLFSPDDEERGERVDDLVNVPAG